MTQRTASTRLDLPQPFGPTTPVRPGSISKSVGSTKDLKPMRRRRVRFIGLVWPYAAAAAAKGIIGSSRRKLEAVGAGGECRIGAENESSGLRAQQRR